MDKVIIIGGKGTAVIIAEQIYDAVTRFNEKIEFLGFAFDDETMGDTINGFPLLCKTYDAYKKYGSYNDVKFIYSLYRPDLMKVRAELLYSFKIPDEKMYTFIHPSALVTRSAKIGSGSVVLANVIINSNSVIGRNNTFNVGTLIGHDTKLGDNNFFAAQVCVGSNLIIGNGNFVGLNSSLRNFLNIGDYNVVGMQSNVTKNILNEQVLYGNPAVVKGPLNNAVR
ncbi:MAG: acetyltransferase [Bacteroidales bacterium]|nr:acetyltransferase [Bacteroidales bacterium]